jgi:hypothetical protein
MGPCFTALATEMAESGRVTSCEADSLSRDVSAQSQHLVVGGTTGGPCQVNSQRIEVSFIVREAVTAGHNYREGKASIHA